MNRIGSSERVRDELVAAFAEGRGVTAKVRWVSKGDDEGRNRWIHCTPLLGQNSNIGVWMVVLVDDEASRPTRRFRQAPPVARDIQGNMEGPRMRNPIVDDSRSFSMTSGNAPMGNSSISGRNDFDFRTFTR